MSRPGDKADRTVERAPYGWAAAAAALAVGAVPAAYAQPRPPAEPAQAAAPSDSTEIVLLEADELIDDQTAGAVTAQGDVQVRYQGRFMRADRLVYDRNTGEMHAIGNVQVVSEDGSITYAEEVNADEAMNVAAANELRARLG